MVIAGGVSSNSLVAFFDLFKVGWGLENIFDVPVLHLGVWVSHRRFKPTHFWHHTHSKSLCCPHIFGTTPTPTISLSVVVWKVASKVSDHLAVSLECREDRGDVEQEPRSS